MAVDDDGEEIQQGPEKDPNDGNDDASDADAEFKAEMAEVTWSTLSRGMRTMTRALTMSTSTVAPIQATRGPSWPLE